jgi:hypothetical protein
VARTPAQSIPSLTSGAGTLLQARTLPSSSRSPVFTTAAPGLPAAEYFRTSTHPEREPFENFVCVCVCVCLGLCPHPGQGPGHPGGRLRVSGISQCTRGGGSKPPRKSHPFDPLLRPCDTALQHPILMPGSPPGRERTARKPSSVSAFLLCHQLSLVRREREVAGESSSSSNLF